MIKNNLRYLNYQSNVEKIINQAIDLFEEVGLAELAEKWDKILKNYTWRKSLEKVT